MPDGRRSRKSDEGLVDLIGHPVATINLAGRPSAALNPAACRLLGVPFVAGARTSLAKAFGPAAAAALARFAGDVASNGAGAVVALACETATGLRQLSFEIARLPKSSTDYVAALREEKVDRSAMETLARTHAVLQTLPVGIELYDRNFNALFFNRKSDELFDYSDHAIANHDAWWDVAFPNPGERKRAVAEWRETVRAAEADPSRAHMREWTVRCRDGLTRTIQFFYRFLDDRFSLVLWDVTEQRRLEAELRVSAQTDGLTGLANRRSFFERADEAVASARAANAPLALLMLDIDRFKAINDGFGHAVGDQTLRAVAVRAASALPDGDVIARLGGEEFAALLTVSAENEARRVAKQLHAAIGGRPVTAGGRTLDVTVSVGGAVLGADDANADALVERADRALYAAKAGGRNRVVFDAG